MITAVLLGTGGMLPLPGRWLSSLLVRVDGRLTLFDCGEGTQIAWRQVGWGFRRLDTICISHTHADHIGGLPGLLHAVANAGRTEPISVFGPAGITSVVRGLRTIAPVLPFGVQVTELEGGERFSLPGGLVGSTETGDHALPVLAYRADLSRGRPFLPNNARALGVPIKLWRRLQMGERVSWGGRSVAPDQVLGPKRSGLAIAYVTDTRPVSPLVKFLTGVDLLICEGTYGSDEDLAKAVRNRHMTFREVATLAQQAAAHRLWITHFSPSLVQPEAFATNATSVFPVAIVGTDGLTIDIPFRDEE